MNGCNRCEFSTRIEEARRVGLILYDYDNSPCSFCELATGHAHTMAFDETRGTPDNGSQRPSAARRKVDQELPVSVLTEVLRGFLELSPRTFRILQRRYQGDSYRQIGEELQVTPQAAEVQLRRALDAHPHLKQLLPKKAARRRKRLSKARRGKPGAGK